MPEIQLNCLAVPSNLVGKISQHHVVTLKINSEESVHSLRREIKKEYTPRFDDIPITEFVVRAAPFSSNNVARNNVPLLLMNTNEGVYPMSVISEHFREQPSKKDIHIIIYLDIQPDRTESRTMRPDS